MLTIQRAGEVIWFLEFEVLTHADFVHGCLWSVDAMLFLKMHQTGVRVEVAKLLEIDYRQCHPCRVSVIPQEGGLKLVTLLG